MVASRSNSNKRGHTSPVFPVFAIFTACNRGTTGHAIRDCGIFTSAMTLVLRSLVVCCTLVVALPPGWCCAVESLLNPSLYRESANRQTCSCCPKCRSNMPTPAKPMPAPPQRCPCLDRDLTTPDTPVKPDLGAANSMMVVLPVPDFALSQLLIAPDCPDSRVSVSPHILNCRWLC